MTFCHSGVSQRGTCQRTLPFVHVLHIHASHLFHTKYVPTRNMTLHHAVCVTGRQQRFLSKHPMPTELMELSTFFHVTNVFSDEIFFNNVDAVQFLRDRGLVDTTCLQVKLIALRSKKGTNMQTPISNENSHLPVFISMSK